MSNWKQHRKEKRVAMTCEYFKEYRSTPLVEESKTMKKFRLALLLG
jgi:hypothetical protein